jgi:isopentenyldiphosphate isomerase
MSKEIIGIIKRFSESLPKFPDGRIDYTTSDIAPVVNIFVKFKDKFLILKRSDRVQNYQGKWNSISGFLDEIKEVREKVLEEIEEESGISKKIVSKMYIADLHELKDKRIGKTWIIIPVLVELDRNPDIRLDWEHSDYKWVKKEELKNFDIVYNLDKVLKRVLD